MTDHHKGLLITALGVLFIVPDSLFVRLIDTDMLTIAFWRNLTSGVVAAVGLMVLARGRVVASVRATGWQGVVYAGGVALSGVMFVAAVSPALPTWSSSSPPCRCLRRCSVGSALESGLHDACC